MSKSRGSWGSLGSCRWHSAPEDTTHEQFKSAIANLEWRIAVGQQSLVWIITLLQEILNGAHCPLCFPIALREVGAACQMFEVVELLVSLG